MKNFLKLMPFFLFLIACQQKIDTKDIQKLNGYWEIEKVVSAEGVKKNYNVNETIDFFQIKNNVGFRKKVTPQFDGRYLVNNQSEVIKIIEKDSKTYISYKTPYAKWNEQIIELSDAKLVLKNEQNIEYQYKKPIPFSVK